MDMSLQAVYSAMDAAQQALEVNAQDLANVRTNGYRPQQPYFESALTATWAAADGSESHLPFGVHLRESQSLGQAGALQSSNNPLNAALSADDDFFAVQTKNGIAYTRNGNFHLDSTGNLVDGQGNAVLGENGPITASNNKGQINKDGSFSSEGSPSQKLRIVNLAGVDIQRKGAQLFTLPAGKEGNPAEGHVLPGQLEGSGADTFKGMADLVQLMHWAESAQKAAHADDDAANAIIQAAKLP